VHTAAIGGACQLDDITDPTWDAMQAVNVRSVFAACQELARRPSDGPREVVLTAALDGIHPVPAPAHFAASQAARLGLVRALSKELGPRGVRINLVTLGVLDGGLSRELGADKANAYRKWSALGRTGSAEEAAKAIRWLALENTYMTGSVVSLTGGL
jgi:3-oxoacyl-[acyl-carrier protein] reductase